MKMVKKGNVKVEQVEAPPRPVGEIFRPAKEVKPIEGLKILVWGATNTGKSHFSLTAPRPTFVIDTEFGIAPIKHKHNQDDLWILEVAQFDPVVKDVDISRSLELLEEALRSVISYIDDNPDIKGTIVIDSITDVWTWLGIWLEEDAAEVFTKTGQLMRTEWGKANRRYYKMILKLLRSKWHVVATAKEDVVRDEKGNPTNQHIPKVQKNTEYWFDIIMRSTLVDKNTRKFTITKFRSLDVYTTFTNPTWSDVVKFIEEQLKTPIK